MLVLAKSVLEALVSAPCDFGGMRQDLDRTRGIRLLARSKDAIVAQKIMDPK